MVTSARKPLRRGLRRRFASSAVSTQWQESSFAEIAWEKSRSAAARWAIVGVVIGLMIGITAFAPAVWLASAVASATQQHILLADARGTVWNGSAVAVLTGGLGARDASALPGRLEWSLSFKGLGFELRAQHECCLNGTVSLHVQPGISRTTFALAPKPDWIGQWPASFLGGLGTPWNTFQLGGSLRLLSSGISVETFKGKVSLLGSAELELLRTSSRLSPLETLGSYRLKASSEPSIANGQPQITLSTLEGALQLSGSGTLTPKGIRLQGEARATSEADEAKLANLLGLIGLRRGATTVISIG